ncbi:MAG: hypothetical protein PVI23_08760 [Maricaulaceae bacterium]|jgi:hypothetical protein
MFKNLLPRRVSGRHPAKRRAREDRVETAKLAASAPRRRPSPQRGVRPPTYGAARDEAVWAAIRSAYVAGETAVSVAARFGVGVSTMTRRARAEGWRRCDVAKAADAALAPPIDAKDFNVADCDIKTLDASRPRPPKGSSATRRRHDASTDVRVDVLGEIAALAAAPDPGRIFTRVFAAADAALARAADASLRADEAAAQSAIKLAESLAKVATALAQARAKAPPPEADTTAAEAGDAADVLAGVERVLGDLAQSRGVEVDALTDRGHDPRDAWMWDEAQGRWVWDPGAVIGKKDAL